MSQMKVITWTNAAAAVARKQSVGFTVDEITTTDTSNGGVWSWNSTMLPSLLEGITNSTGLVVAADGFTPLVENVNYGAVVTGFTVAAPGVISVDDSVTAGFAIGDTITVAGLSDDGAGTDPLNGTFTIASLTAIALTLVESTLGFSAYVSGGFVTRVSDVNGVAIPIENFARLGIEIGTNVVGANDAVMTAVIHGQNSVT